MTINVSDIRGVLFDIEGTISSIGFVYDVMFPFVLRELDDFLAVSEDQPAVIAASEQIASDAGFSSLSDWCAASGNSPLQTIAEEVRRLMAADVKATGLKALQGQVWRSGFASGELVAHVFPDVVPALQAFRERQVDLRVYSSGSVGAQKLFFGHTECGNLLPYFSDHYDTTLGSKKEAASYHEISTYFRTPIDQLLFLSDVVAELDAARASGWRTGLCCRPGNAVVDDDHGHPRLASFSELSFAT